MKEQSELVTSDEWLLRRVHGNYVNARKIVPNAFKPIGKTGKTPDTTGISLYRQSCLSFANDVFNDTPAENKPKYGIASVSVEFLWSIGIRVEREDDSIPGHVVLPELSYVQYDTKKEITWNLMVMLADHVNEKASLIHPFPHDQKTRWIANREAYGEYL